MRREKTEFCTLKSSNSTVVGGVCFWRRFLFFFWSSSPFFVVDTHKIVPLTVQYFCRALSPDPHYFRPAVLLLSPWAYVGTAQPLLQSPALPQIGQMMALGSGDADVAAMNVPRPAILLAMFYAIARPGRGGVVHSESSEDRSLGHSSSSA